jgi:hypothetical protein
LLLRERGRRGAERTHQDEERHSQQGEAISPSESGRAAGRPQPHGPARATGSYAAGQGQQLTDDDCCAGPDQQQEDEHTLIQCFQWLSEHSMQYPHCSNADEAASPDWPGRPDDGSSSREDTEPDAPTADRRPDI